MIQPKTTIPMQQLYACPPGSLVGGLRRTRFFDGMFLTQADLENEQVYWRMKRRLTNRALGTGIVWGLKVSFDPKTQIVSLTPGYALDCCGNDLIVEHVIEFPAWRAELAQLLAHLDVDTTAGVTPALVTRVIASWRSRGADRALLREA